MKEPRFWAGDNNGVWTVQNICAVIQAILVVNLQSLETTGGLCSNETSAPKWTFNAIHDCNFKLQFVFSNNCYGGFEYDLIPNTGTPQVDYGI